MFRVSREIYEAMLREAEAGLPNESCGILSGKAGTATRFYRMTNVEKSPVRYLMEPREQFKVMKDIRSRGERMLAIYHSHVASQAYPSATDVALAFYPDVRYVIVSLENRKAPLVRAFRIKAEKVREEPLELVEDRDL